MEITAPLRKERLLRQLLLHLRKRRRRRQLLWSLSSLRSRRCRNRQRSRRHYRRNLRTGSRIRTSRLRSISNSSAKLCLLKSLDSRSMTNSFKKTTRATNTSQGMLIYSLSIIMSFISMRRLLQLQIIIYWLQR